MALKIGPKQIGRQRRGRPGIESASRLKKAVAIAFSYSGIVKLGCKETEAHPFPSPFRSGMGSDLRALLLRDRPRQWRWSDVDGGRLRPRACSDCRMDSLRGAHPPVSDIDEKVFCINQDRQRPTRIRQEEKAIRKRDCARRSGFAMALHSR